MTNLDDKKREEIRKEIWDVLAKIIRNAVFNDQTEEKKKHNYVTEL